MRISAAIDFDLSNKGLGKVFYETLKESYEKGDLDKIFCGRNETKINPERIKNFPYRFLTKNLIRFMGKIGESDNGYYYSAKIFDNYVYKNLKKTDIFYSWQGSCLKSINKAKDLGTITVLECCNPHIKKTNDILAREHKRLELDYKKNKKWEKRLSECYKQADYLLCQSKFVANSFIEYGIKKEKIIIASLGVDSERFTPSKEEKNNKKLKIICAGHHSIRKGTHILIEAWNELKLNNAELLLIGGIDPKIKEYLSKVKSDSIRYLGKKQNIEIYYRQGDLFVLPTLEDGFGMVILEAMVSGLPVITTTNSGGPDVIDDQKEGFIINPGDKEQIKKKILYFYKNPEEVRKFGKKARKKAEKFTWEKRSKKVLMEFKKLKKC